MIAQTHIPGCTSSSVEPSSCPCGCHRGIVNALHEVKRVKVRRYPLDPHFTPTCVTCGVVGPTTDAEDAKRAGRQHVAQVAHVAVAEVE